MALFFGFKAQAPFKVPIISSVWHHDYPLLAVATSNGVVSLYSEEGERREEASISRSCNATALAWHPSFQTLYTGWKDGAIIITSLLHDKSVKDATSAALHEAAVTGIYWSPDGTRMVTTDRTGIICVWKLDERGKLTTLHRYEANSAVTHLVFKTGKKKSDHTTSATPTSDSNAASTDPATIFFFGCGVEGTVFVADDMGHCNEAFTSGSKLAALLYHEDKRAIVAMTETSTMSMYSITDDWKLQQIMKVKVSTGASQDGNGELQAKWVGKGLLATCMPNAENMIRLWNLDHDENYVLSLAEIQNTNRTSTAVSSTKVEEYSMAANRNVPVLQTNPITYENITCFDFNPRKRVIAVGTKDGFVHFWQYIGSQEESRSQDDWEWISEYQVNGNIVNINWGPGDTVLSTHDGEAVTILHETILQRKMRDNLAAIQTSTDSLAVENLDTKKVFPIRCKVRIKGIDLTQSNLVIWGSKSVELYEIIQGNSTRPSKSFDIKAQYVGLHNEGLYIAIESRIEVFNFQGTRKQTLNFTELEGNPICLDIHGDHLAVATDKGFIKLWNISGREAKQSGMPKQVFAHGGFCITSIKLNVNGTRVSILSRSGTKGSSLWYPSKKLLVYNVEQDTIDAYDMRDQHRYPISHFWDQTEPKLLAIETKGLSGSDIDDSDSVNASRIEVATLFSTLTTGVLLQDSFALDRAFSALVGVSVPSLFFVAKGAADGSSIERVSLRDFEGINISDSKTRDALLNFSYFLTTGNMDEAYKAVKLIKDKNVWQNMAQMCVKTKRLDVAEVCLGNMEDAVGAAALREAKKEPQIEARIGMLAIQLGLYDDAERLYKQCKRYDLLNKMYQAMGQWDKALEVAKKHDRIHLRTTHYEYARHLESVGDYSEALRHYEESNTHRYEVPRMLFDANEIRDLENYVRNSDNDPELCKWWAAYCESNANYEGALMYYMKANDVLSVVRLYCFMKQIAKAAQIVTESGNAAAAYHLARHLEEMTRYKEAIQFYTLAHRYKHAIRLAKEMGLEHEVMSLALQAPPQIMMDAAAFFEERGMLDKAVLMYQKAGNLSKAIDLCFRGELFDVLTTIAEKLDAETDPEVLIKCAHFFVEHRRYDKAVPMFINAHDYEQALDLCIKYNVRLTEEMAEQMTPPKTTDPEETNKRNNLLRAIAKVAKQQRQYHLACKKFTQAGDKVKAMKVLIKSGDTEKIILFANVSRQKEILIMAANWLQSLDWHNDKEILKSIISFYTKAHALESLSAFYEACSQVEIDEYRDYEKALGALKEALKYITKARTHDKEARIMALKNRIFLVEKFVQARRMVKSDPAEMVKMCHQLLEETDVEDAIRVGDVYALLVEFYHSQGSMEQAYNLIEKMRDRNIILSYYLDQAMVETVYSAMGISTMHDAGDNGEEIIEDEEIVED